MWMDNITMTYDMLDALSTGAQYYRQYIEAPSQPRWNCDPMPWFDIDGHRYIRQEDSWVRAREEAVCWSPYVGRHHTQMVACERTGVPTEPDSWDTSELDEFLSGFSIIPDA